MKKIKTKIKRLKLFLLLLVFFSCNKPSAPFKKLVGYTQGTYYAISYYGEEDYTNKINKILAEVDYCCSSYDSLSLISLFNANNKITTGNKDLIFLLQESKRISKLTNNAFDITVGEIVNLWGFGSKKIKTEASATIVDSLIQFVGINKITINKNSVEKQHKETIVDFNAIAQGYTVDKIVRKFEAIGLENFLIDIGGEIYAKGKKINGENWVVGIEKPTDNNSKRELFAYISLKDKAIATSGNYRKFYIKNGKKFAHTINPATGFPVRHNLLSVSVIADKTYIADAFATAFMVLGLNEAKKILKKRKELATFFIYEDENGKIKSYHNSNFKQYLIDS